ncbi:hypothetical protein C8Q78DRAFT_329837 [Trametes maxima]|nr:hypothetical protein C8Q78DRAFT_329837 [Trametes maxima]
MEHGRPRRRQSDHDFDFGGNGWDDAEENFELMLNTISRVFGNSQDMRRALRESMAAAFGSDAVPAMFRIDEEVEELEDDQVDDEDPDFILPSLAESIQSMPSLGEFDLALAEPSQLEEVDPDPVSQEVDETSTPSLIQSNLDPTIPAFVPSRLQPLRPPRVAPTPSYHLDRLRPLPVGLESSDAATPEEEHESIPADPSFSDFEPLTDAELDAVAPGTRSRRLAPSASLDATLRALGYTDHEEPGSSGTIQEAYRVMGIPRHEAVLPGSSLDIPPMPSVSLLDYSPVTSSSSPSVGNLTNATSTSTPSLDTPLDRPPSVQLPVPDATLVLNIDPPFVTDGRGHVVGSSLSSRGRRGRAASSSAAISPHPKVGPDALFSEDRDGDSCHGSPLQRPVSLVRQRSLPLVGASSAPGEDSTGRPAEFVTDGRGRVVYASSNPATSQCP